MNVIRRRTRYYRHGEPESLDLHETDLYGANLSEANLEGAILYGANLLNIPELTQVQLEEAYGDENTLLPSHLEPPAHWGVKIDEQVEEN